MGGLYANSEMIFSFMRYNMVLVSWLYMKGGFSNVLDYLDRLQSPRSLHRDLAGNESVERCAIGETPFKSILK